MSFDISKFKKDYQKMALLNREHADRIAKFETEKAEAVKIAVATATRPLNERIADLAAQVKERASAISKECATNAGLVADIDDLNKELAAVHAAIALATDERDTARAAVPAAEAQLVLERQKVVNLTELLGRVQDRMRRRERDEQQAILNRKAVMGVAPGLNRR